MVKPVNYLVEAFEESHDCEIEFASSDHGKDVFEQFGFIEKEDRATMDSVEFE